MTKRVLAFLMVIAMVFSLIPTVVVAEDVAESTAAFEVIVQKSHNQPAEGVNVDIYLQAAAAAEVTAFQVTFDRVLGVVATEDGVQGTAVNVDAEGNEIPADDTTTEVASEATKLVYPPADAAAEENPPIAVEAGRTLLATVNAAALADVKVSLVEVTIDGGFYTNDETRTEADGYLGEAAVTTLGYACEGHDCGHGEGTWTEFVLPEAASGKHNLAAGKYYLTSDVQLSGSLDFAEAGAEVTICLNGFSITGYSNDSSSKGDGIVVLSKAGTFNICDCTASGEGVGYTAGKLLPKKVKWGGVFRTENGVAATINMYGGVIDGTDVADQKEGSLAWILGGGTLNLLGGKVVNMDGLDNSNGIINLRGTKPVDTVMEANARIEGVTFVGCSECIVAAPAGGSTAAEKQQNDAVNLVVKDVTITDSVSGTYAIDIRGERFKSVLLEGNCQFDVPVYVGSGQKVTLNLGENADVNIATADPLTEAQFNERVKKAEGGSLIDGTLLYETAGVFVTYDTTTGLFTFEEGHTIADKYAKGIIFKAWDRDDSLPKLTNAGDESYYLTKDVTITNAEDLQYSKTLNLDLNGHTITCGTNVRAYNVWNATLNLFDGSSQFDAEGNWTGAGTGAIKDYGDVRGAIRVYAGGTFNLYSGRLENNGRNAMDCIGGAVYVSAFESGRSTQPGAIFNMYGGEIKGNKAGRFGAAVVAYTDDTLPETHVPAEINIHGGKIYNNTTVVTADADAQGNGTIYANNDTKVTISGGEFTENTARQGGVVALYGDATLTVTGGKIHNNSAVAYGGVVYTSGTSDVTMTGTADKHLVIENNSCDGPSGVVHAISTGTFRATYVDFKNNSASSAGVTYLNSAGGNAVFTNCTMTGNTTTGNSSAIRMASSATMTLDDTVITGNSSGAPNWSSGAIYQTNVGNKVTLSGATVIAGNTGSDTTKPQAYDFVFQGNQATPTIYVNELSAGAHVNLYNYSNDGRTADALVQVNEAAGHTQTNWECGWITYYETTSTSNQVYVTVAGESVSRIEGVFTFGHYHGDQVYQPITSAADLTAATAGYYYLANDISVGDNCATNSTSWVPVDGVTLCFNGNDFISTTAHAIRNTTTDATITMQDCTGTYSNDEYIGGGITSTSTQSSSGRGIYVDSTSKLVVNWEGGKIYGITAKKTGTGEQGGTAIYIRSNAKSGTAVNFSGGAVCGNILTDNADTVTGTKRGVIQINAGTLNITGGSFYRNECHTLGTGTAEASVIRYAGGTLSISNAKFFENKTDGSGAIQYGSGTLNITNCEFRNNEASTKGGAIYQTSGTINLVNCVFDGNKANLGGAIAMRSARSTSSTTATNAYLYIRNGCEFVNNEATTNGGAISSELVSTSGGKNTVRHYVNINTKKTGEDSLVFDDCLFENNKAGVEGGVISSTGGSTCYFYINMQDSTFRNNSADPENSKAWGGVACLRNYAYLDTCNDCVFEGNKAYDSGVFHQQGSSTRVQDPTNCRFINNSATSAGGVSRVNWASATNNYLNCTFEGNTAAHGGAFYTEGGSTTMITFGQIADDGTVSNGCTFKGNKATAAEGKGGAIFATNPHSGDNTSDYAPKVYFYDTTFTENEAYSGGAIYATAQTADANEDGEPDYPYNSDVTIDGCYFTKNKATGNAAAVAVYARGVVRMKDSIVQNNEDNVRGAVYVATNKASLTLSGQMNITNNTGKTFPNADLVFQHSTDGAQYDPVVDVSGLTAGSLIGINATDGRYERTPVLGSAVPAEPTGSEDYTAFSDYFFSNDENRFVTYVTDTGDLILTKYVTEDGYFDSVQDAIENAADSGEEFTFQAGTTETVEIPDGITSVDLNGATVSEIVVPVGQELTLKDTASDFNSSADEIGKVKVTGEVKSEFESDGKRYMVVTDDEGYASVHRVHLVLSHRLLRPATFGAGFKANFYADEVLSEKVTYGVLFSFDETAEGSDFENEDATYWFAADFYEMAPGYESGVKPNQKILAVTNLLTDGEDNMWDQDLYGVPFVNVGGTITHQEIDGKVHSRISGGTTLYGAKQTVNMKTLAQNAFRSGDDTVAKKVADMLIAKGLDGSVFDN